VLTFEDNNTPVFGRPAFRIEGKLKNRVIFEYAEDVVMTARYNKENKMIVFDHLSPIEPALKNNPVSMPRIPHMTDLYSGKVSGNLSGMSM